MVFYSYAQSVTKFTEADKNRIVAIFLNMEDASTNDKINWEASRLAYGSASVESMKKSLSNTLKKVVVDDAATAALPATLNPDGTIPKTPASKGKPKGRKRKTSDADEDDADGAGETVTPTPKKTKKGRAAVKKEEQGSGDDGEAAVEDEPLTPKKTRTPRGKSASATKAKAAKTVKEEAKKDEGEDAALDEDVADDKDDMA